MITAVTDPVAAKLVNSMEAPGTNVSGTTDINPVEDQLKLLKEVFPGAKNVGIIYNSSEVNSVVQVDLAKAQAAVLTSEVTAYGCDERARVTTPMGRTS